MQLRKSRHEVLSTHTASAAANLQQVLLLMKLSEVRSEEEEREEGREGERESGRDRQTLRQTDRQTERMHKDQTLFHRSVNRRVLSR